MDVAAFVAKLPRPAVLADAIIGTTFGIKVRGAGDPESAWGRAHYRGVQADRGQLKFKLRSLFLACGERPAIIAM
jgi:hypothetical protein